jgi:hypothetical protein
MTSVLSNYAGNQALAGLLNRKGLYLACHDTDPTVLGLLASEVAGGGYIRQRIIMSVPGTKTCASTNAQTFPGMPACVVTYLAIWTAISAGDMIVAILLPTALTVPASGQVLAAAGDIAVTL